MELTLFDYLIIVIMLFFVTLGLLKGFIKELLSLINWTGSALVTTFFKPILAKSLSNTITNSIMLNFISSFVTFIIVIILLSIITSQLAQKISTKIPMSINITLGFAFGFIKGFLISSLIFCSILSVFGDTENLSDKSGPKWLQNSITYRPLSFGTYVILPFTNSVSGKIKDSTKDMNILKESESKEYIFDRLNKNNEDDIKEIKETINEIIDDKEKIKKNKERDIQDILDDKKKDLNGYKKNQVKELERLIDIIE